MHAHEQFLTCSLPDARTRRHTGTRTLMYTFQCTHCLHFSSPLSPDTFFPYLSVSMHSISHTTIRTHYAYPSFPPLFLSPSSTHTGARALTDCILPIINTLSHTHSHTYPCGSSPIPSLTSAYTPSLPFPLFLTHPFFKIPFPLFLTQTHKCTQILMENSCSSNHGESLDSCPGPVTRG